MMEGMRLRTWLIGGYGIVLFVAVTGLALGLIAAVNLADISEQMVSEDFTSVETAARLRRLANEEQVAFTQVPAQDGAAMAARMEAFGEVARPLAALTRAAAGKDAATVEHMDRIDAALDAIGVRAASLAGGTLPASGAREAFFSDIETIRDRGLVLYRDRYDAMVAHGRSIKTQSVRLAWLLGALAVVTFGVGIWASTRIAQRLVHPMEHLVRASDRVATGDFTVRTSRSGLVEPDRVAQRFDEMVAALERFHAMNLDRIVAERRRLDQVVANIDDGLVLLDEHGNIERVNPVAALQLGVDADVAIGQRIDAVIDVPALSDDVGRLLARPGETPSAAADLSVDSDGTRRTLSCTLLPFSSSARMGLILMLRDVTEQRRFEQMRTDFILRASHELRTPITGMRMAIGLLRDKIRFAPENARESELFTTLQQETERLVALITELFDLSRLYANADQRVMAPVDPADLLERVHARSLPDAQACGVHLELILPARLPMLQLDAGAIERVLDNLVSNAMRHTSDHGRVRLGAEMAGEDVALWVEDTGEGIAAADRTRVFEPFTQLAGSKVGGAGLGLAMCREIVHQHGGRIQLDSTVGEGSRFTLLLPV